MYRHSAQINVARSSLPSPARDESSDSESEILAELDEKRRQIDDEIASFRTQKEKEFQNFERELRSKRKHTQSQRKINQSAHDTSAISAVSDLFAGNQLRPNGLDKGKKISDGLSNSRPRPSAPPSKATVVVDKLTINGTTTPPIIGTPPPTRSLSRSPTDLSITPPRKSASRLPNARDEEKSNFSGLFTPSYLPLLEARRSSPLPPARIASHKAKRAVTAPAVCSASLPSALRTSSSSTIRKRKHVTFQLGDTTIVEPSSSYEEIPSPHTHDASKRFDEMVNDATEDKAPVPISPKSAGGSVAASDGDDGVGFFELDEELDDRDDREVDYHEDEDEMKDYHEDDAEDGLTTSGSFHTGSLPIDIVKPGNSR